MDVFHHERHCSLCKQRDYLPVQCEACNQYYCSDHLHYLQHDCEQFQKRQNRATEADLELASQRKSQKPTCHRRKCSQSTLLIECRHCHHRHCLSHRLPEDHSCNSPAIREQQRLKRLKIMRQRNQQKNASTSSAAPQQTHIPTPLKRRTGVHVLSKRHSGEALQFANSTSEPAMPVFKPNLLPENQRFIDIFFPFESNLQPLHFVVPASWKIGKLRDALCKMASIANRASSPLHLYSLRNGTRARDSATVRDYTKNGEAFLLEKGAESLSQGQCLKLIGLLKGGQQNGTSCKLESSLESLRFRVEECMKQCAVSG